MALTVTATLVDPTNTDNAGYIVFTLVGFQPTPPRISGTSCIAAAPIKAQANGSGAVSQVIIGNDVITPSGTLYQVDIYNASGALISSARYQFTGSGSVDLSSLTPLGSD
ncbi:MAG: hypothetical protein WAU89_17950 [Candidatus Acidiferrales bacterium]